MSTILEIIISLLILTSYQCEAQSDSTKASLKKIPIKYITKIVSKIDKYSSRITNNTEKTFVKFSKWKKEIEIYFPTQFCLFDINT